MFRPQVRRNLFGVHRLVKSRVVEADRKRQRRAGRLPLRDRGDETRVDPTAEKDAEGHVAAQAQRDRRREQVVEPIHGVGEGSGERLPFGLEVPIPCRLEARRAHP